MPVCSVRFFSFIRGMKHWSNVLFHAIFKSEAVGKTQLDKTPHYHAEWIYFATKKYNRILFLPYSISPHFSHLLVESHLFLFLTCTWVAASAPTLVPLLQLKASLQWAPHKSLQPLLNATQCSDLSFKHLTTSFTVYGLCGLIENGHVEAPHKTQITAVAPARTLNGLTLSSSSCCLLFSSTAALRSSSFCLCSSSLFQRSSTVRSYCSRALRSFSLISCSRAAGRNVSALSQAAVQRCWCCFYWV